MKKLYTSKITNVWMTCSNNTNRLFNIILYVITTFVLFDSMHKYVFIPAKRTTKNKINTKIIWKWQAIYFQCPNLFTNNLRLQETITIRFRYLNWTVDFSGTHVDQAVENRKLRLTYCVSFLLFSLFSLSCRLSLPFNVQL